MLVKNIKINGNNVEIILNDSSFVISKENYIENPVLINRDISEEKILFLLNEEKYLQLKVKLIKKLSKKVMTEKEVAKLIKEENVSEKRTKELIKYLINIGLINDQYCAQIVIESMLLKKKGKLEIKRELLEKGLKEEIVNQMIEEIDDCIYLKNFQKVCDKYIKMYENKSYKYKDSMIRIKLKEQGYEDNLINTFYIENDSEKEIDNAKKQLLKIIKDNKEDITDYKKNNKIKLKMINKGYSYDIIRLAMQEVLKDETN